MDKVVVAGARPVVLELEPGTYWWCACGRSESQPFCDGAHRGTGLAPVKLEITEATKVPMCMCKHSADVPRCDGSHTKL
ncbi:MAG: CDGSH iron-sulfur domain-containing protein [Armatimonadia bacterium]|nr:CDGSH iron-sulfur domain-containing protein [Armatimonadia bacterium]